LLSATLVAVTVTAWVVLTNVGAVYNPPAVIVPTDGLILQLTPVLLLPVTVAVNCCVCEANSAGVAGLTVTATGAKVTVAVAHLLLSAALVAVTVTAWIVATDAGAVYNPSAVIVPTGGLILQLTAVLAVNS
jgi:hypothetical protein